VKSLPELPKSPELPKLKIAFAIGLRECFACDELYDFSILAVTAILAIPAISNYCPQF
jgi:hypothetical protein